MVTMLQYSNYSFCFSLISTQQTTVTSRVKHFPIGLLRDNGVVYMNPVEIPINNKICINLKKLDRLNTVKNNNIHFFQNIWIY